MALVFNPLSPTGFDFTGAVGGGSGPAVRYVTTFDATTSWGAPSGGNYSIVITQATHTRGTNPNVQVYEKIGADYFQLQTQVKIDAAGDITLSVNETPDLRFEGAILVL